MKTIVLALLSVFPVWAHVNSMSAGDVTVNGARARYELRMPIYEIAHIKAPESALFEHIRFSAAGQQARLTQKSCREDSDFYLCVGDYEFPAPVARLDVECTFHKITVPNHVHLLRAQKDGKSDQAILDFSFSKAQIRFQPPTALETVATQIGAGFVRAAGGLIPILFLATLALAARSPRELAALAGMFLVGQILTAAIVPGTSWDPPSRFVEAATALTIAYMAVEILALPNAGKRWLIAGVLGIFHGLYFALFLRASGFRPAYVLIGATFCELTLISLFAFCFSRVGRLSTRFQPARVAAGLLLGVGMFWFFLRLKS